MFTESTEDLEVSEMTCEDVAEVLLIGQENNLSYWSEESYLTEIDNKESIALSVRFKGKQAGFMIARLIILNISNSKNYGSEILNIAISKDLQNRGLGQILLSKFLKLIESRNVSEIWLEVRETNLIAIKFYKKNGFFEHSERKNYYSNPTENALIMKKTIDFNEQFET